MDQVTADILRQAWGLGAVPITLGVVEAIKRRAPKGTSGLVWVALALLVPIVVNLVVAFGLHSDYGLAVAVGTLSGFLTMAAYDKVDKPITDDGLQTASVGERLKTFMPKS